MASSIEIVGLRKSYGPLAVLDDVAVSVRAGEFLTLLGPSGSGKTTLLMAVAGFVRPSSGSIRVDGREIMTLAPHKRNIGMVFQNYALFPHMTVGENVAYPLKLRGVALAAREERARRALDAVQMAAYAERHIDQLSGGQRQRVAVARAILQVVGRTEMKLLGPFVVLPDRAPIGAGELVGVGDDRAEYGLQVKRRAEVWLTSPSACSSPTERVSWAVRVCSSVSSRAFSIAMAAWSAKVSMSAMWPALNGRTS